MLTSVWELGTNTENIGIKWMFELDGTRPKPDCCYGIYPIKVKWYEHLSVESPTVAKCSLVTGNFSRFHGATAREFSAVCGHADVARR